MEPDPVIRGVEAVTQRGGDLVHAVVKRSPLDVQPVSRFGLIESRLGVHVQRRQQAPVRCRVM